MLPILPDAYPHQYGPRDRFLKRSPMPHPTEQKVPSIDPYYPGQGTQTLASLTISFSVKGQPSDVLAVVDVDLTTKK